MTEAQQVDTTLVIGVTPEGRKVHLAWKRTGAILCDLSRRGPAVNDVIADLGEEGGEDETMAVLNEHTIPVSRLCAHCFSIRFRTRLASRRRAAGLRTTG
jgi:hypothetical protein